MDRDIVRLVAVSACAVIENTMQIVGLYIADRHGIPAEMVGILADLLTGPVITIVISAVIVPCVIVNGLPVEAVIVMYRDSVSTFPARGCLRRRLRIGTVDPVFRFSAAQVQNDILCLSILVFVKYHTEGTDRKIQ